MSPTILGIAILVVVISFPWLLVEQAVSRSKRKPKAWPLIRMIVLVTDLAAIALLWVLGFARELGDFALGTVG